MGRIEKTVFISYRRTNFYTALAVYQDLSSHGYDVFFDYQSIDSGNFEKTIFENIAARAHFVLVLSSSALERCSQPNDWLRREIETAIELKRNIVPLMMEGFDFGSPTTIEALSGKLATLNTYNGLKLYADYFFDAMEKLRTRFLNKALDDLRSHAVSKQKQKETNETKKAAANEAAPVEAEQLTAEEWFERGLHCTRNKNYEEAFRCYKEAIQLEPDLDAAHNNLGLLLRDLKRNDEAEAAYRKAIELNPSYDRSLLQLGITPQRPETQRRSRSRLSQSHRTQSRLRQSLLQLGRTPQRPETQRRSRSRLSQSHRTQSRLRQSLLQLGRTPQRPETQRRSRSRLSQSHRTQSRLRQSLLQLGESPPQPETQRRSRSRLSQSHRTQSRLRQSLLQLG